eukprot:scaffold253725_cov32-Tisochrysis_lutea.AAC.1
MSLHERFPTPHAHGASKTEAQPWESTERGPLLRPPRGIAADESGDISTSPLWNSTCVLSSAPDPANMLRTSVLTCRSTSSDILSTASPIPLSASASSWLAFSSRSASSTCCSLESSASPNVGACSSAPIALMVRSSSHEYKSSFRGPQCVENGLPTNLSSTSCMRGQRAMTACAQPAIDGACEHNRPIAARSASCAPRAARCLVRWPSPTCTDGMSMAAAALAAAAAAAGSSLSAICEKSDCTLS